MNKQFFIPVALAAAVMTGCSSIPNPLNTTDVDQDLYDEYASECTFKDGKTTAPKWICGYPIEEYPISEVGYSAAANEAEAVASARVDLVARMRSEVESVEQIDTQTFGRQERKEYSARSRVVVNGHVINTRGLLTLVDPTTQGLYVLVVAEADAYEQAMREAQQQQDGEMPSPKVELEE